MSGNVLVVLDKQSKVGAGSTIAMNGDSIGGFSVSVSGAGNVSARVRLEIANDPGGPWVSDAASIVSLSGICSATTYLRSTTHFEYIRAVVESISAGASVSVFFGDFASSGTGFYQQDNLVFGETNPLTGGIELVAGGKKIQSAEIHPYYHFHGFAGDQFSGDSKFYDKAAGNHGSFGANLSLAQAWATAGYVSTVEPVAGAVDSVIRIPSLNFDYSGGEKLIIWGLGAITPEGADVSLMGDCPFAQASLGGVRVRAKANGKLDIVLFGAGSVGRYSGQSTAVPFDGALHSYAFALDGTTKKYGMWVDEAYEPVFGPDYSVFSAGQDADTRNPGTWNIGAASPAPGGTEGMATRHRALVILRMPASAEMPSVATLTALFKQLRANPGRLISAGAI